MLCVQRPHLSLSNLQFCQKVDLSSLMYNELAFALFCFICGYCNCPAGGKARVGNPRLIFS